MTAPPLPPAAPTELPPPERPVRRNPFLNLFFGRDAVLEPGPLRIMRLVALGIMFENYDIGLVNSALKQIAENLAMAPGDTGYYLGMVRLGGFGALLLVPFADRIGRRRVFLVSLIGMSIGTFCTGLVQTPWQFVVLQVVTRTFMLTGVALAVVILVEEFPASQRGGALGLLSLLGGLGYGVGAGLYAAVDYLPYGWRALYALGLLPLALLPFFRRTLRETRRFEHHAEQRGDMAAPNSLRAWAAPFAELMRAHPRRVLIIGLAGLLASMGSISVFQYTSYFVQEAHGWQPGQYSLLVLGGGLIGMVGTWIGGRGSDRFGRRGVGFFCLALAPLFALFFFLGPAAALVVCWGLYVLGMSAGEVIVRALAAELFATSHRGTSGGILIAVQTMGFSTGLFVVGFFTDSFGDLAPTVSLVSFASVGAALCLLFVPETKGRELEAISGEDVT